MPISRRHLFAATAALPLVNIGRARASDLNYKVALNLPATHPMGVRAAEACARIAEATGGQVAMQTYPGSQLGSDTDTLAKLRSGEVEFFLLSGSVLSSVVPLASISNLGFVFKTYQQVWSAMDGKFGAYIRDDISKHGMFAIGRIWNNGFRQLTSSTKPIVSPDDLRGFKLRIPVSPLWISMFTKFGALPASLNLNKAYTALQEHVVEGQENPLALIQATKFYEVQAYCSLSYHIWDGYWVLVNEAVWRGLPSQTRDIIEHEFDRSGQDERDDLARADPGLRGDLALTGMKLNVVDTTPFQVVLEKAGFYEEWRKTYGDAPWHLLEEHVGLLS